jgi:hypothetical protein
MDRLTVDNPVLFDDLTDELKNEIREEFTWFDEETLEGRKWGYVANNWMYWSV